MLDLLKGGHPMKRVNTNISKHAANNMILTATCTLDYSSLRMLISEIAALALLNPGADAVKLG
jgi:hypothetical protein